MKLKRYTVTNINERPVHPSNVRRPHRSLFWHWIFTLGAAVSSLFGIYLYITQP